MSTKTGVLNYEQYKKRYPDTKMTKAEYEQKYFSDVVDDVGRGVGTPARSTSQVAQPQSGGAGGSQPKINETKYDADKGFKALFDYMGTGKVKTKEDASKLIRRLGYNESEFADHCFNNLGKSVNFEQIKQMTDLGVFPKSYVERKIKFNDLEKHVPPKYYEEFGIKGASAKTSVMFKLLNEIQDLEGALGAPACACGCGGTCGCGESCGCKTASKLSMLDKAFIEYMKKKGKDQDGIAAQLQMAAASGNSDYLQDLQKALNAKDLMELASAILKQ